MRDSIALMRGGVLACGVALLLAAGCAKKKRLPAAQPPAIGASEVGLASWYGHPYHGRPAASGEIYDMERLTAAHRTLPFGTRVRVENLDNGRHVEVRINDRGPFVEGRILDLSRAAARRIAMLGPGTARVRLVVVAPPARLSDGDYFAVQTGAFRELANAERQRRSLEPRYGEVRLLRWEGDPPLWRVQVGRLASQQEAEALARRLRAELGEAFVVRVDASSADHL